MFYIFDRKNMLYIFSLNSVIGHSLFVVWATIHCIIKRGRHWLTEISIDISHTHLILFSFHKDLLELNWHRLKLISVTWMLTTNLWRWWKETKLTVIYFVWYVNCDIFISFILICKSSYKSYSPAFIFLWILW